MDCNKCVCALVCMHANKGAEYREQVRSGEINCCDYFPRPDDELKKVIHAVSEMDAASGVPQDVYVIEECSELIKELMKKRRGKGSVKDILEEACDVLTTVFVLLNQYEVPEDVVKAQILYKCNRALERYRRNGEV